MGGGARRDLVGLPISHELVSEPVLEPHAKVRFDRLAALLAADDLTVKDLLRSALTSQLRCARSDSADFLEALPGFGVALATHKPALASPFRKPALAQKLRAVSLLAAAGTEARAAFADDLMDLALDASMPDPFEHDPHEYEHLLAQVLLGDDRAARMLVGRLAPLIRRVVSRLAPRNVREGLVQEVWAHLWARNCLVLQRWDRRGSFVHYVAVVTRGASVTELVDSGSLRDRDGSRHSSGVGGLAVIRDDDRC